MLNVCFKQSIFFSFILCLLVSAKKQKYLPRPKKHGYPIWESDSYSHIQEAKTLATCMFYPLTLSWERGNEVRHQALFPMLKKKNVTGAYPFSKWFNVPLAFHPIGLGVEGISPLETKWEAYGKPLPKELCSGRSHFNEAAGQAFSFHHGRHRCQSMAFHQAAGDSRWRRAFPRWDNDPKPVVSASSHGTTTGIHHKTDQETEN